MIRRLDFRSVSRRLFLAVLLIAPLQALCAQESGPVSTLPRQFSWVSGAPVVTPRDVAGISVISIKDPTVIHHNGRWHLFCTIRGKERSHAVVYLNFAAWNEADRAEWRLLTNHTGYFCAPQVFYFTPHRKWYLICQASSDNWEPHYQPAYATTNDLSDPDSWSPLQPLYGYQPENLKGWIDFWVICDTARAHLFFTSNDGRMWRAQTALSDFPIGWSTPVLVLEDAIFEASHTYQVSNSNLYLTLIEEQNGDGWRYFKAYTSATLDGVWKPLAATKDHAFASLKNVRQTSGHWTDSISHGELLRSGVDERLQIDPGQLIFLYQGVLEQDRVGRKYGDIPWKLGLLKQE